MFGDVERVAFRLDEATEHLGGAVVAVQYCLECDEIETREIGSTFSNSCQFEHPESLLIEDKAVSQISSWLDCIEYLGLVE